MRWDRFFDDLEDQLASEWEAERAALDTEAERLRLSRVALRERLTQLADGTATLSFEFAGGAVVRAGVSGVGADWVALAPPEGRARAMVAPLASIESIGMPHAELLRSARPSAGRPRSSLAERVTFGFVLRDLSRRRVGVAIHLTSARALTGTIDRAGVDHLDLAMHEPGEHRRADAVTGHRVVPFASVAWISVDAGVEPAMP